MQRILPVNLATSAGAVRFDKQNIIDYLKRRKIAADVLMPMRKTYGVFSGQTPVQDSS
jgi:hypothetical protein